jgi:hypothetical protein
MDYLKRIFKLQKLVILWIFSYLTTLIQVQRFVDIEDNLKHMHWLIRGQYNDTVPTTYVIHKLVNVVFNDTILTTRIINLLVRQSYACV